MNSNRFLAMNEGSIENRKKMIEKIKKDLNEIDENPSEIVPLTNCKQLNHLNGMIDQSSPPKISPFAPQLEMVTNVMKENQKYLKRTNSTGGVLFNLGPSRTFSEPVSSNCNNSILVSSPSSPILPSMIQNLTNHSLNDSEINLKLDIIPNNRSIIKQFLALDEEDSDNVNKCVVKPEEFLELKD